MTLDNAIAIATLNFMEKQKQQRTLKQNDSLHLYFEMWSQALNDAGIPVQVAIKPFMDLQFTPLNIKEIWKVIQRIQLGKEHTAQLTTDEVGKIDREFSKHWAENFGLHVPFPSEDELANQ